MPLPDLLRHRIEEILKDAPISHLRKEQLHLTAAYCAPKVKKIETHSQHLAYLATRLPATYAVCDYVLKIFSSYNLSFSSLLDLCAGPGTASICATFRFPQLQTITLMDTDPYFKKFAEDCLKGEDYHYSLNDITTLKTLPPHDIVMLSYGLNEIPTTHVTSLIQNAWQATKIAFIIIEPGTPRAFERLRMARQNLIKQGATILAPCPHEAPCPLSGKDWCHFSRRLERLPFHRDIKGGSLSYEDEKFSYLIATKQEYSHSNARIIKKPLKRKGHVIFDLCTSHGVKRHSISKKAPLHYKETLSLEWGDVFPQDVPE